MHDLRTVFLAKVRSKLSSYANQNQIVETGKWAKIVYLALLERSAPTDMLVFLLNKLICRPSLSFISERSQTPSVPTATHEPCT